MTRRIQRICFITLLVVIAAGIIAACSNDRADRADSVRTSRDYNSSARGNLNNASPSDNNPAGVDNSSGMSDNRNGVNTTPPRSNPDNPSGNDPNLTGDKQINPDKSTAPQDR